LRALSAVAGMVWALRLRHCSQTTKNTTTRVNITDTAQIARKVQKSSRPSAPIRMLYGVPASDLIAE
jgi:hypothetical protein